MVKTSKWKEGREVVLVLSCHPSNTTLTHSLSFTLMAKTKNGRSKLKQLQFLATKHKNTTLFSGSAQTEDPRGVFIGTRGKGATWEARGPKRRRARVQRAAETRPGPRFRGPARAARAWLRAARRPVCLLTP